MNQAEAVKQQQQKNPQMLPHPLKAPVTTVLGSLNVYFMAPLTSVSFM